MPRSLALFSFSGYDAIVCDNLSRQGHAITGGALHWHAQIAATLSPRNAALLLLQARPRAQLSASVVVVVLVVYAVVTRPFETSVLCSHVRKRLFGPQLDRRLSHCVVQGEVRASLAFGLGPQTVLGKYSLALRATLVVTCERALR